MRYLTQEEKECEEEYEKELRGKNVAEFKRKLNTVTILAQRLKVLESDPNKLPF